MANSLPLDLKECNLQEKGIPLRVMEKKGIILLAQIDHLSGEEIAWISERLPSEGLYNRQIIPTLTKKGRPGYILLLDVDPDKEKEISRFLFQRIDVGGYHRLETSHVHERTASKQVMVTVCHGPNSVKAHLRLNYPEKRSINYASFESDDLIKLYDQVLKELGVDISPLEFKRRLEILIRETSGGSLELEL